MSPVALKGTAAAQEAAQGPSCVSTPGSHSVADALANMEFNLE